VAEIVLNVRHVDQSAEYWKISMEATSEGFCAVIPGEYTDSLYDLQYFFEVRSEAGRTWLHPGFDADFVQSQMVFDLGALRAFLERAAELLEKSLALHRAAKDTRGVALSLGDLANVSSDRGSYERARTWASHAVYGVTTALVLRALDR
jgi:hypothetical protein